MSHQVVRVRREAVAPCMTCPLCHKLFREATTIIECLHTFCRKCIYKKLSDEEMEYCPICNIDLGTAPLEKLRPDHNLQDVRAKIFPDKRIKAKAPEVVTPVEVVPPVAVPAKRKERSLSSLVVSTPRVSTQSGTTGRRSKSTARKASRGSSFTIEKRKKDGNSIEDHPESSSSPDTLNKNTSNMRQNSVASEPSNDPSPDKGRINGSQSWEGKVDLWKPLNCLVEAANRSKSSRSSIPAAVKSEDLHYPENEGPVNRLRNKESRLKTKFQDEKNNSDHTPSDSERPKKSRRVRQKKARDSAEPRVPSQVVLDASGANKFERRNHPIWFALVASDEQEGDGPPLPQISANYIRMKDGTIPVGFIQRFLKTKLNLRSEDEVEIRCMGQTVIPSLTLNNLLDLWLQTTTADRVSATMGSCAKDFVMVLGYARRVPDS